MQNTLMEIVEDIIMKTEDDTDRTTRGLQLTQTLWEEFYCLWIADRNEARVAALTFFVKMLENLTRAQREQTLEFVQIACEGLNKNPDHKAFCSFIADKLREFD